jgi:hypothetical protein
MLSITPAGPLRRLRQNYHEASRLETKKAGCQGASKRLRSRSRDGATNECRGFPNPAILPGIGGNFGSLRALRVHRVTDY